jgi:hypothetical protein
MFEIGGSNFPKTISSKLGSKLARIYKKQGLEDIKKALKTSYEVLKANTTIKDINENSFEVCSKYPQNFCPIGGKGKTNTKKAKLIQDSICIPFTQGFLTELEPDYKYDGHIEECILETGNNICRYIFRLEKR